MSSSATTVEPITARPATARQEGHAMPESGSAAVRVTTVAAVSVVAAVAATVSFMHMHHLAHRADEGWRAWLVPLARSFAHA